MLKLLTLAVTCALLAQGGSANATPKEAFAPSSSLSLAGAIHIADDSSMLSGLGTAGSLDIRNRMLVGKKAVYCAGADVNFGASSQGVVYEANAYLLGAGMRFGQSSFVALCSGAGLGGASGAIPFAWQVPAEVTMELQAGPVRVGLWGRANWALGTASRDDGSTSLGWADEMSLGVALRLGRATTYWDNRSTNHGYFVAAHYKELMGTSMVGVSLGVGFWGGQ